MRRSTSQAANAASRVFVRSGAGASIIFACTLVSCSDPFLVCGGGTSPQIKSTEDQRKAVVTGVRYINVFRRSDNGTLNRLDDSAEVLPRELEFKIELDYMYPPLSNVQISWLGISWPIFDVFISSAQACSQVGPPPQLSSQLSGADLVSDASMGAGLDAGSSLARAFKIKIAKPPGYTYESSEIPPAVPLNEFASASAETAWFSYDLVAGSSNAALLMPTSRQLHRFTFTITLTDGNTYSVTSIPVRVLASN